jgi:hypothetical protein
MAKGRLDEGLEPTIEKEDEKLDSQTGTQRQSIPGVAFLWYEETGVKLRPSLRKPETNRGVEESLVLEAGGSLASCGVVSTPAWPRSTARTRTIHVGREWVGIFGRKATTWRRDRPHQRSRWGLQVVESACLTG